MRETVTGAEGALLALLAALAVVRGWYELRHRRHWRGLSAPDRRSMIAPLLLGGLWLAAAARWGLELGPVPRTDAGAPLLGVGTIVTLAGIGLFARAHAALGDRFALAVTVPRQPPVHRGPYARVRHPMYAAGILILSGTALITLDPPMAGIGAAYVVVLVRRIPREDALLAVAFGEAHRRYVETTPALVPRVGQR